MADVRMPDGMLHAQRAEVHWSPPRVYPAGRVCEEASCRTILSIYNDSTRCARHLGFADTTRGHRVHRGRRTTRSDALAA